MPLEPSPDLEIPQRTTPALIASLVFHVVVLTCLGFLVAAKPKGSGEEVTRRVGIALVHQLPDRTRYVDVAETPKPQQQSQQVGESENVATAAAPPADVSAPIDLDGILSAMTSDVAAISGTGLSGDSRFGTEDLGTAGGTIGIGDGEKATTTVFGVSGTGSRFVYVFDRSDSMNGYSGRPLRAAKGELIRSLDSLTEKQQFQIIFYNDQPKPFQISGSPVQMFWGDQQMRDRAKSYVDAAPAFGSTEHQSAILMALRMSPDVIFFLTDARVPRLSHSQLAGIRRRAEQSGTTIHAIEFGAEASLPDSFLRDLAQQNRGQYQYVDVRRLGGGK